MLKTNNKIKQNKNKNNKQSHNKNNAQNKLANKSSTVIKQYIKHHNVKITIPNNNGVQKIAFSKTSNTFKLQPLKNYELTEEYKILVAQQTQLEYTLKTESQKHVIIALNIEYSQMKDPLATVSINDKNASTYQLTHHTLILTFYNTPAHIMTIQQIGTLPSVIHIQKLASKHTTDDKIVISKTNKADTTITTSINKELCTNIVTTKNKNKIVFDEQLLHSFSSQTEEQEISDSGSDAGEGEEEEEEEESEELSQNNQLNSSKNPMLGNNNEQPVKQLPLKQYIKQITKNQIQDKTNIIQVDAKQAKITLYYQYDTRIPLDMQQNTYTIQQEGITLLAQAPLLATNSKYNTTINVFKALIFE